MKENHINMTRFYRCDICGSMVGELHKAGTLVCCGQPMTELAANTTDATLEKHVPVVALNGDELTVKVGSVAHPMADEHYIEWIYVRTEKGGQRRGFVPGQEPELVFNVSQDKPVEVLVYCNLHGLWASKI